MAVMWVGILYSCPLPRLRRSALSRVGLWAGLSLQALLLVACGTPSQRLDASAAKLGFAQRLYKGTDFQHVVYQSSTFRRNKGPVHVYIDGDGSPFLALKTLPPDPTPRWPLVLDLAALDGAPSIYLGRPCYAGLSDVPPCGVWWWTMGRYSEPVVTSMVAVLRQVLEDRDSNKVVLIGYSGGGTLAFLMAERLPEVTRVVTIAGNLDTAAWTNYHGFTPLTASLNPATRPALPVSQLHLVAGRDKNVPPAIIAGFLRRQPAAKVISYDDFDHECCWSTIWPAALDAVD